MLNTVFRQHFLFPTPLKGNNDTENFLAEIDFLDLINVASRKKIPS